MEINSKQKNEEREGFSVIMPTYNQAAFIRRAILSLEKQSFKKWELIIINDGSTDNTEECIHDIILNNEKIKYIKNEDNKGIGYAINQGLEIAKHRIISYLPSDDFYYKNHLATIKSLYDQSDEVTLVFSGMNYANKDSLNTQQSDNKTKHIKKSFCLQLVQTSHRKTHLRWMERQELVTEDLSLMFWNSLLGEGIFTSTNKITCHWTQHPFQHHKLSSEKYGGNINAYRSYYNIQEPLNIRLSKSKYIYEEKNYQTYRKINNKKSDGLKILLVGELSYNPERIYALEEYGHTLYGLWIQNPGYSFSNIGHFPFGNIEDIEYDKYEGTWKDKIKKIKPDIIYALSNWDGVDLAYSVLKANLGIPFVWHFKEGPFVCMANGDWPKLFELYLYADGKIFINNETKDWFSQFLPITSPYFLMDLDPPKKEVFSNNLSRKLSAKDNSIHTVIPGRMIGLDHNDIKMLAKYDIHLHLYSESAHDGRRSHNTFLKKIAPDHFHIHPHVSSRKWVEEFSKYDAGWLHCFNSKNYGDLSKATWDDLNIPARLYTLAAAKLPMIQRDNFKHRVAMQDIVQRTGVGLFFKSISNLSATLHDKEKMSQIRSNLDRSRYQFCFDSHVPDLSSFFQIIIKQFQQ